jgi:hypothetical protein
VYITTIPSLEHLGSLLVPLFIFFWLFYCIFLKTLLHVTSINQSINQSVNQSINQSINQSAPKYGYRLLLWFPMQTGDKWCNRNVQLKPINSYFLLVNKSVADIWKCADISDIWFVEIVTRDTKENSMLN